MKKWYDEEYEFTIEVTGFLRGSRTEYYCRNGEEIGDRYTCTYGCPVNGQGQGICANQKRRRPGKYRRQRKIYERSCVSRRLRVVPADSKKA